jgi:hypothetical protein
MKVLSLILVVILLIGSLVVGKIHWNNKVAAFAGMESTLKLSEQQIDETEKITKNPEADLIKYTNNLPEEVKQKINQAVTTKQSLKFVILGSKSTPEHETGWPRLLQQKLEEVYGEELFNITIHEITDKNSSDVVKERLYEEALEQKPDLLLLEPFILKDNGEVQMEDRLENIQTIMEEFINVNPEVHIFLQPSNPLYGATYYPKEVETLHGFSVENKITYLDHWEAWPDPDSIEIQEYLEDDPTVPFKSIPSENGHKIWAAYLQSYFISNK